MEFIISLKEMKEKKINVIVTGLSGGSYGMQILKALKLSKQPYNLIGTNNTKKSYGASKERICCFCWRWN